MNEVSDEVQLPSRLPYFCKLAIANCGRMLWSQDDGRLSDESLA